MSNTLKYNTILFQHHLLPKQFFQQIYVQHIFLHALRFSKLLKRRATHAVNAKCRRNIWAGGPNNKRLMLNVKRWLNTFNEDT